MSDINPLGALRSLTKKENFDYCQKIAEKLEIQADGGDSAGEFVRQALHDVYMDRRIEFAENSLNELKQRRELAHE